MRTPKLLKAERTKLDRLVPEYLKAIGAKEQPRATRALEYLLDTVVGPLVICYYQNDDGYCPTLFTRFDNPKAAKTIVDCNPHSGKYNCHLNVSKGETAANVLSRFEMHLRPILCHIKAPSKLGQDSAKFILSLYPIETPTKLVS